MVRKVAALVLATFLAACGGDDFSIQIDKPAKLVAYELAKVKPNVLTHTAGLDRVTTEKLDGGSVRFTLPNRDGDDGTVLFKVVERDTNASSVSVTIDIPTITRHGAEGAQILSESKMEDALKGALSSWGEKLESGQSTTQPLSDVSEMVSLFAIGMQDFDEFESIATAALFAKYQDEMAHASWSSGGENWGDESGETEWAYEDSESESGGWGQ